MDKLKVKWEEAPKVQKAVAVFVVLVIVLSLASGGVAVS
jgi:uncharacterized membrane protein